MGTNFEAGDMQTIGLIAAMPQESRALLRGLKEWKRTALDRVGAIRFQLLDRNCLLVTSGMGLARAVDGARSLLSATSPHLVVSFGIAGAVDADLRIGDVVVARNTCLLEKGLPGPLWPLASLSKAAWNAAAQALQPYGAHLVIGTAITTRGSQIVLQPSQEMTHPVLEMETTGIARVAAEMGIPCLSIRSISDGPQSPIPFDLEAVLDEKYNFRMARILRLVLHSPQIAFQFGKMMHNSRIAAAHAARALLAVLSQPSPIIS
ncbi:MAG: hypothetical protein JXB85_12630 [Anaerolineales bacterium]|nr:hypothetical protein [Anaerolineales bacterium]